MQGELQTWKKGTPASPATALAIKVLPTPGSPSNRTPLGGLASLVNRSSVGFCRKVTICCSLSMTWSSPATSENLTSVMPSLRALALDCAYSLAACKSSGRTSGALHYIGLYSTPACMETTSHDETKQWCTQACWRQLLDMNTNSDMLLHAGHGFSKRATKQDAHKVVCWTQLLNKKANNDVQKAACWTQLLKMKENIYAHTVACWAHFFTTTTNYDTQCLPRVCVVHMREQMYDRTVECDEHDACLTIMHNKR